MENAYINTIYRATEGEGIFIGTPQIFVRFQGCTVGCVNCDSKDTWDFKPESLMGFESVLDQIEMLAHKSHFPLKRVSITGGDPLHPKHVPILLKLVRELKNRGYWINLEAAGTRIVPDIFDIIDYISFDIKTPSTEVKTSFDLLLKMHEMYAGKIQIKAVVSDLKDFEYVQEAFTKIQDKLGWHAVPWVMTPSFETEADKPYERMKLIQKLNEDNGTIFRVVAQQHKFIYGASRLDV